MESSAGPSRKTIKRKSSALLGALNRHSSNSSQLPGTGLPDDEIPPLPSPGLESLRATMQKRLTTWGYLRRVHQSRAHWMNTYLFAREELDLALARGQIGGAPPRTQRLAVLGMSIANLLDVSVPAEFLRGLASLTSEWENFDGEVRPKSSKNRMRTLKSRKSGIFDHEESFLFFPNIPFELDYFEVLYSLCDMLVELYTKLLLLLGGQPNTPLAQGLTSATFVMQASGATLSPEIRPAISTAMLEQISKIDNKLRRLLTTMTKELETLAREAIRKEIARLNIDGASFELIDQQPSHS